MNPLATLKSSKFLIRFIISLLFSFAILFLLLRVAEWQNVPVTQKRLELKWLAVGALAYWAEVTLVGIRAAILLSTKGTLSRITVLLVSNLHNFINKVSPARTGELSFLFLLQYYAQTKHKQALSVLVVARLADFYTMSLMVPASLIFSHQVQLFSYYWWLWLSAALGFILLPTVALTKYACKFIDQIEQVPLISKSRRLSILLNFWRDLCLLTETVIRGKLLKVGMCSIAIWFLLYCTFIALGRAMNIGELSLEYFLVSGSLAIVGTMIPIGIGHFGSLEAGWTLGLTYFGIPYGDAVLSAVWISLSTTLFALLMAITSLIFLKLIFRRSRSF